MSVLAGARVGAFEIVGDLWDNPGRGRYRGWGMDPPGSVLVATTGPQRATIEMLRLRLEIPLDRIAPLRAIGPVDSAFGRGQLDAVVEDEPAGRPLADWRRQVGRAAWTSLGATIADVVAAAHARGFALGGLRPELIYADRVADELALTAIAPRAIGFYATGSPPDAGNVPAFDDVFEPVDISAGRKLPTPASDVFTLACALGTLIAGRHPFGTGSWGQQIDAMTRLDGAWPELDDPALRVLETALVRDAAARPTAAALRDRLAALG